MIARESAKIRTSFAQVRELGVYVSRGSAAEHRAADAWAGLFFSSSGWLAHARLQNETEYKPRNIAKLLYIHMLGYPTQFGALETIALCAQPQFTAKRIGYLGLMLLLDEDTELLMMVTNSLRLDLKHLNQFVVGLALSSLANVGSAGMARDLAPDIEQLLGSPNTYIRKKAALCAVRIVRKVPEMAERYAARVRALLADKVPTGRKKRVRCASCCAGGSPARVQNHAVLLTGLQLLIELCELDHSYISMFKEVVPSLVALLKVSPTLGPSCAVAQENVRHPLFPLPPPPPPTHTESCHVWLRPRVRSERHLRSLLASQGVARAVRAGHTRRACQRRHERHSGAGDHQY